MTLAFYNLPLGVPMVYRPKFTFVEQIGKLNDFNSLKNWSFNVVLFSNDVRDPQSSGDEVSSRVATSGVSSTYQLPYRRHISIDWNTLRRGYGSYYYY